MEVGLGAGDDDADAVAGFEYVVLWLQVRGQTVGLVGAHVLLAEQEAGLRPAAGDDLEIGGVRAHGGVGIAPGVARCALAEAGGAGEGDDAALDRMVDPLGGAVSTGADVAPDGEDALGGLGLRRRRACGRRAPHRSVAVDRS